MKKILCFVVPVVLAVAAWQFATAQEAGSHPRVLLVTGFGTYEGMGAETPYEITAAAMGEKGWSIGSMESVEVLAASAADLATDWDVIWILPGTETLMHTGLSAADSPVEAFVRNGGLVVMPGIPTVEPSTDVAPGGLDVFPEADPGTTVITDPNHPLISAAASGGVNLTAADLDPNGTGGKGCFGTAPEGTTSTCVAHNDVRSVITEYSLGTGKVVASLPDLLGSRCLSNLLLFVDSVVQGS